MKLKLNLFIFVIAMSLLSTKCAEETIFFTFKNNTNFNIAMTSIKDTATLREMYERGTYIQSEFNTVSGRITKKIPFIESDLNFYYSTNGEFYTFYFFKYSIVDRFNNKIIFNKKYDSINVAIDEINIGVEKNNTFIANAGKISFYNK
ncbi:hypothetical protein [Flavobacterium sp. N3904]|uniref:hypothetical protein n=1 Tax=Flavobacterium sp. N3904 TaxID=2986835 RepID=UPI002224E1FD|nr:hypothetical protein [Flavobacterium sp. N3904]